MNHSSDEASWLSFLGWITIGIACLLLMVFVLYPRLQESFPSSPELNPGATVYRKKIPQQIVTTENTIVAAVETMAPKQPAASVAVIDSPVKNETPPPATKPTTSQPIVATPEPNNPRQEIESHLPAVEYPVSSATIVAPPERGDLSGETDLLQAEVSMLPTEEGVIEKIEVRIIHSEDWLLSQKSSNTTIQLMGVRDVTLLFDFVERYELLEQNEIAFYQTTFKDKPWFQLLYGVYATRKDAQSAAANLPQKIQKSSPWIRRFSAIQKAIRNQAAR